MSALKVIPESTINENSINNWDVSANVHSPTVSWLVSWPCSLRTLMVTFFSERSTNKLSWEERKESKEPR